MSACPQDFFSFIPSEAPWTWFLSATLFLALDIFLPIPANIIMGYSGFQFGVIQGGVINLCSACLANLGAYFIGLLFTNLASSSKLVSDLEKSKHILSKYGSWMLFFSRPLPIISESLVIIAGCMKWPLQKFIPVIVIGNAIPAFMFSWAGQEIKQLNENILLFTFFIFFCILLFFIGKHINSKSS